MYNKKNKKKHFMGRVWKTANFQKKKEKAVSELTIKTKQMWMHNESKTKKSNAW